MLSRRLHSSQQALEVGQLGDALSVARDVELGDLLQTVQLGRLGLDAGDHGPQALPLGVGRGRQGEQTRKVAEELHLEESVCVAPQRLLWMSEPGRPNAVAFLRPKDKRKICRKIYQDTIKKRMSPEPTLGVTALVHTVSGLEK